MTCHTQLRRPTEPPSLLPGVAHSPVYTPPGFSIAHPVQKGIPPAKRQPELGWSLVAGTILAVSLVAWAAMIFIAWEALH